MDSKDIKEVKKEVKDGDAKKDGADSSMSLDEPIISGELKLSSKVIYYSLVCCAQLRISLV